MNPYFQTVAGLCLALFLSGCGEARYRLEGKTLGGIQAVMLLDGAASDSVRALRATYGREMEHLKENTQVALDSLQAGSASLTAPLRQAQSGYQAARRRFREAFLGLQKFRSFGGNPVFSSEDLRVPTARLLEEIADRFYKGKAFSLETEGEVRRYIRERLVPLEKRVNRARVRVNNLQKSQKGSAKAREQVEADFELQSAKLLEQSNQAILKGLQERTLAEAPVDSNGAFLFLELPVGQYHLYVPEPLPKAWLVSLEIQGHTRRDLGDDNLGQLLMEGEK